LDQLLRDLVLVFVLAGTVLLLFHRLRLPSVVGLLLAGVLIGPHGLAVLDDSRQIDRLAELGVLLLMFSIGLDFTPDRLGELARALRLGAAQMLICIVVTALVAAPLVGWARAIFLGMLVAHTSSTLMLKVFLDRGESASMNVRLGLGISIIQDLSVVPMLLAIPVIAGAGATAGGFGLAIVKASAAVGLAVAVGRWVLPWILEYAVRSRDLLLVLVIVVCLGMAWTTTLVGLSAALGAFLAGIAIAASIYGHQTLAEVVPFRDVMVSLFFISIGMLVDMAGMAQHLGLAILVAACVITLKFMSGFVPVLASGYPVGTATAVGLGIAQIGEFAFVLGHAGREAQVLQTELFQPFVLVAILTMLVSPFLIALGPHLGRALERVSALRRLTGRALAHDPEESRENHVIIAGLGLNGRTLLRAMRSLAMPHVALDLDPTAVREAREAGESVVYGDCSRSEVLRRVAVETARVFVVAISDPRATRQAVRAARQANPAVHIIVRTKYAAEIEPLRNLGATEVISEEFETALEILARALHVYILPRSRIEETVDRFRGNAYQAFRGPSPIPAGDAILGALLPTLQLETFALPPGSPAAGVSLRDVDLRAKTGATVLAVRRQDRMHTVPPASFQLAAGDVVILAGTTRQIIAAARLLEPDTGGGSEGSS